MTKSTFTLDILYDRRDKKGLHKTVTVEATSARRAKEIASSNFKSDWRRRNSKIIRIDHIGGTAPVKAAAPCPEGCIPAPSPVTLSIGTRLKLNRGPKVGTAEVRSLYRARNGREMVAVEMLTDGSSGVLSVQKLREYSQPKVTTEYYSIYPNGAQYASDRPILSSSYGVENLVQVKVTKVDGRIVGKEFV